MPTTDILVEVGSQYVHAERFPHAALALRTTLRPADLLPGNRLPSLALAAAVRDDEEITVLVIAERKR